MCVCVCECVSVCLRVCMFNAICRKFCGVELMARVEAQTVKPVRASSENAQEVGKPRLLHPNGEESSVHNIPFQVSLEAWL